VILQKRREIYSKDKKQIATDGGETLEIGK